MDRNDTDVNESGGAIEMDGNDTDVDRGAEEEAEAEAEEESRADVGSARAALTASVRDDGSDGPDAAGEGGSGNGNENGNGNGGWKRLKRRLTIVERNFLETLLEEGTDEHIVRAHEKLRDDALFSHHHHHHSDEEEDDGTAAANNNGSGGGGAKRERRAPSARREQYLNERQRAQLHRNLWDVHDAKVKATPRDKWKRMLRRVIALRGMSRSSAKDVVAGTGKEEDAAMEEEEKRLEKAFSEREHLKVMEEGEGGFEMMIGELLLSENLDAGVVASAPPPPPAPSSPSSPGRRRGWEALKSAAAAEGATSNQDGPPPFLILGTSATDESCVPHVLSPPLMETLRNAMPYALSEDNFWLKYSLVRDGASLISLLDHVRGSRHTVLAIETVEGEVFGSFTSAPWRKTRGYFGTGESLLWRMRKPRTMDCSSLEQQTEDEADVEIHKWKGVNDVVQLCSGDRMAVGGGDGNSKTDPFGDGVSEEKKEGESGFGLAVEHDLLQGTSSSSATFGNPPLCRIGDDDGGDGVFEIANLEVWTMTPFMFEKDAEENEMMRLFVEENANF